MTESSLSKRVKHRSHTENVADCEWCPFPAAREQATPSSDEPTLRAALTEALRGVHLVALRENQSCNALAVELVLPVVAAALAARESEVRREVAKLFTRTWVCHAIFSSAVHGVTACTPEKPHGGNWACCYAYHSSLTAGQFRRFFGEVGA